ncbi:MAG: UDP-glucose/GDP-mannose dehydrogenase family protein [Fimbriimonadaceae bacterium]
MLGVSYKRDIADEQESPALEIIEKLQEHGATVEYYDHYIPEFSHGNLSMKSIELTDAAISGADMVMITTEHTNVDYAKCCGEGSTRDGYTQRNAGHHRSQ